MCVDGVRQHTKFMETLLADLAAHRVDVAACTLDSALDVHRDPRAMDVCKVAALEQGHVVALYKLVRNGLKWSSTGAVPCTRTLMQAVVHAMLLLLRVGQDVQACVTDLGRPERAWVFQAFVRKVGSWLAAWPPAALPTLHAVAAQVHDWNSEVTQWPNPAWAASFHSPLLMGTTFTFGRPRHEDVAAFDRCQTLQATRADVCSRLCEALEASANWEVALGAALAGVVTMP
jgi:hypothetical protein